MFSSHAHVDDDENNIIYSILEKEEKTHYTELLHILMELGSTHCLVVDRELEYNK